MTEPRKPTLEDNIQLITAFLPGHSRMCIACSNQFCGCPYGCRRKAFAEIVAKLRKAERELEGEQAAAVAERRARLEAEARAGRLDKVISRLLNSADPVVLKSINDILREARREET